MQTVFQETFCPTCSCNIDHVGFVFSFSDSFWDTLCPFLEVETKNDLLWQRIIQQLIKRVPDQYLESVLDGIMKFITP